MDHLTKAQLFVGALIIVVCVILVFRAILQHRRNEAAPFRDYFGPEYDRDMLQQSELSESEEWRADRRYSFTPFRLRDPGASERR
jgi:hypothetical protein